jgi:hypothetical protein
MGPGRTWMSAAGLVLAASSAAAQNSMGYITDLPGLSVVVRLTIISTKLYFSGIADQD